jgi:glycerol kinase
MHVLAIDQGTTNTKALVFDENGRISASASAPCATDYPASGWAEQSASQIWETTQAVIAEVLSKFGGDISAIGIANQRETIVAWDGETGEPVGPAPIWQCRRTADQCAELISLGFEETVAKKTGLGINPLFPASKLAWIFRNRPEASDLYDKGRLRAGTVDAWLLWKLTAGNAYATDHSNASRTLLFDTEKLEWCPRLAEIFGVPADVLPAPAPSDERFGETAAGATALPAGIPIHAIMGDSHAALFGHGIRTPGEVKATYGTGSSLMALTSGRTLSNHRLSGTIAWTQGGTTRYALEGNITVSAHASAFAAKLLGLADAAALSELAQTVPDTEGVTFVPALAGLGAPHWDDNARGVIAGLSLGSAPAHVARATFEAIAHQIADVLDAMVEDLGHPLGVLSADGGASANSWLMQLQADLIGIPVERKAFPEIGALGVAKMALEAMGHDHLPKDVETNVFTPGMETGPRRELRRKWRLAVENARSG